jgi:hypothetical protein
MNGLPVARPMAAWLDDRQKLAGLASATIPKQQRGKSVVNQPTITDKENDDD